MNEKTGTLTPRPYARLLTMLSDQLIKNNSIALTELAKNSYDADAEWIQIRIVNMKNFDSKKKLNEDEKPFVEIMDCGDGMSLHTITDSWMNPASPEKYKKRLEKESKTRKGRIMQGEKGIGRYAVFQIGKRVEITTRERIGENQGGEEITLVTDLTKYDKDLLSAKKEENSEKPLYFDQIESEYNVADKPNIITHGKIKIEGEILEKKNHGTLIRITELNYRWTRSEVKKIRETLDRLQSPFGKKDFAVGVIFEGEQITGYEDFDLDNVLEEAVIGMEGYVDEKGICHYSLDTGETSRESEFDLVDSLKSAKLKKEDREHFFDDKNNRSHNPECGPFNFKFYVYDLEKLDKQIKEYVRSHRIYIYRDGFRVYPYGDRDNDWIKLDIFRGIVKAAYYLSNDQVIGYIDISAEDNPYLIDKTNREGLLEQGTAYEDLRLLTLSILNYLHSDYLRYKIEPKKKRLRQRKNKLYLQSERVKKDIDRLYAHLDKVHDLEGKKKLNQLSKDYFKETAIYGNQIDLVEDLAGVGLAVDATSHDVMLVVSQAKKKIKELHEFMKKRRPDLRILREKTEEVREQIYFIDSLLVGIQPLFRSARRRDRDIRLFDIVKTVKQYYNSYLEENKIEVDIKGTKKHLILKSSEGVLLQIFINLMDNAVYWLKTDNIRKPKIEIMINRKDNSVIFADNGRGVKKEDINYIFEAFFSRKGVHGRGLGLYIARELADKHDYDLYYVEEKSEKILPGANFKIDFTGKGN